MKQQKGISLIEVLIALVILATGFVVLIEFQANLSRKVSGISQQFEAKVIAQDRLDQLRHFVALTTAEGSPSYQQIVSGNATVSKPGTTYAVVWTVSTVANPPHKVVRVVVSWTDQANASQSVVIDGIIGANDPMNTGTVSQSL